MTIGGWIVFVVLAIVIVMLCILLGAFAGEGKGAVVGLVVAIPLIIGLYAGMHWYYTNTEDGKRAFKTQESNFNGGIRRHVSVYDAVGNLLQEWDGTFDVDFSGDEQRILFDDENGFRHVIYFKTGTVIVEETENDI